jgi:hypothetical protein
MLTDVRMFWKYSTANKKYEKQTDLSNKIAEDWYSTRMVDLRIGDVVKYYTFAGTGFAHLYYSRRIDDMMLEAEDPRNVFPIDPISTHTLDDCKGVVIRKARTPEWVREEFNKVVPAETGGTGALFGWLRRNTVEGPGERGGPLSKKSKADKAIPGTPTCFVNTMYLKDPRVNKTNKVMYRGPWKDGRPQAPWSYEVKPGEIIFPFMRMICWCGNVLLYDDTSPYWHGKFPLIKLTMNPWPMSWFGKAPLWDCLPLQRSVDANLKVIDDHASQVAQPGVVGDRNVSKAEMNKFNSRAPGYKIRTNMASGKGISIVNPPPLEPIIWESVKWCIEQMGEISGKVDVGSVASLGQLPSDDTIDTLMKAMTPRIRLRSRILEGFYKELAMQYLYCIAQFDTLVKRVLKFGPSAATKEDFDFDPRTFIPDDIPDGEPGDIAGTESALTSSQPRPLHVRAKMMLSAITTKYDPSSLLNTAAKQELMEYFMMAKMGYISAFTLMDKMGVANFAPPNMVIPDDEIGRLALQAQLGLGMIANAQGRKATDGAPPSMGQNSSGPIIQTS